MTTPDITPHTAPDTVAALLAEARGLGVARLDAQLLLAHVLQRPRAWLLAHDEAAVGAAEAARVRTLLRRRADAEPLAYLVGTREFRGLELLVGPAVLVPRPETELLVAWALSLLPAPQAGRAPAVVDLGTGSGAIALALAQERPDIALTATDASADALALAAENARRSDFRVAFRRGDWWQAVAGASFELAVSNPPYIAAGDPHLPALRHEPLSALSPGGDGLGALRAIVAGAAAHLAPGAPLLLEHGHDQGPAVRTLLDAAGFEAVETRRDLAGLERCSGGRRPR
jgi:release factor glutamine methyltransferase